MSSSDILTFSSEDIEGLPLYYRALAKHLANTGRAKIEDPSEQTDKEKGF